MELKMCYCYTFLALLLLKLGVVPGVCGPVVRDGAVLAEFKSRVETLRSGRGQGQEARGSVTYASPGCGLGNTLISLQVALSIAWVEGRPLGRPAPGRVLKDKVFSRYFHWPVSALPAVTSPSANLKATPVVQINMLPGDGAKKYGKLDPMKRVVVSTCWEHDPAGLLQRSGAPVLSELLSQPTAHTKGLIRAKKKQIGWEDRIPRCFRVGVQIRVGVDNGREFHRRGFHKKTPEQVECALREVSKLDGPVCVYITSDAMDKVLPEVEAYLAANPETRDKVQIKLQPPQKFMHSATRLSESEEDKTMTEWLILGEADMLYGTGTSFSTSAANRTGVPYRKLPYKEATACQAL